jgi:signal transduction histidine kinase
VIYPVTIRVRPLTAASDLGSTGVFCRVWYFGLGLFLRPRMKLYFEKKVVAGLIITISILISLGVYAYVNNRALLSASREVSHLNDVLYHLERTLGRAADMETGARGFALTRDSALLAPYEQGAGETHQHIAHLLAADDLANGTQQRILALQRLLEQKRQFSAELIARSKALGSRVVLDKVLMDSIRQAVASLQYQQTQRLHQCETEMSRRIWHSDVAFISLLGTTIVILIAVFSTLHVYLAGRSRAEERAARLNRELEAFTYSVSHDLRAPLRSIHGYSQILIEEYGEKLDADGRRIANTIIKNARKMGRLIDDLLDFSHVGRSTLHHVRVNMYDLVEAVLADVDQKKRENLQVHVHTLPWASADINLIRQVWKNLISNALKYSSKKEFPQVWISAFESGTEIVYSIRDNGVGFDMQYVHKLFGVFQRLHKEDEFEGTGVGLALAYRIVALHGGRVWAEAAPAQGATFYFSLPRTVKP